MEKSLSLEFSAFTRNENNKFFQPNYPRLIFRPLEARRKHRQILQHEVCLLWAVSGNEDKTITELNILPSQLFINGK